jgi:hypothetical protein
MGMAAGCGAGGGRWAARWIVRELRGQGVAAERPGGRDSYKSPKQKPKTNCPSRSLSPKRHGVARSQREAGELWADGAAVR